MPSVYFHTFGCQMNVADSMALLRSLARRGYAQAASPEKADLIIVNTCSVREHAERRARARIAEFAALKRGRAGARLWVIGCMAERLGGRLKRELPGIDLVIGARQLENPETVARLNLGGAVCGVARQDEAGVSEFIPVMRGCNNFCAYCIVPYVRGPEHSISAGDIIRVIGERVAAGVREVTLLGQNVNSYRDEVVDFPELLGRVASIGGLERIRFTTSHPKDCSEKLLRAIAQTPKLCRHLHLPVQAGSDRVLSLMNRGYTTASYLSLIDRARELAPDIDITTDLIVGFPSESERDFEETLALVERVRFTAAFMFAYSPREGTAAASLDDDVPRSLKIERLNRLIGLQTAITKERYGCIVGRDIEVLVYGSVKKGEVLFFRAQDRGCKRVLVACTGAIPGTILQVRAVRSSGMTLIAERI